MRRIAGLAGVLVLVLLVLAVAQIVLPGLAASSLRDRLSRSGRVLSVQVSAFPAIELLWHDADKVVIRMADYRSSTGHLTSLLDQAGGVGTLDVSAQVLTAGLLTMRDARLTKHGSRLYGTARIEQSDLRSAIPFLRAVSYVGGGDGGLTLQGTADVLGAEATVPATIRPVGGRLVVSPDVPFGGLVTLTVFSDPRVRVESVSGGPISGGLDVSAQGVLQ